MTASHIVIDLRRSELRCERCGGFEVLAPGVYPVTGWLEAVSEQVCRFSMRHPCPPRPLDLFADEAR